MKMSTEETKTCQQCGGRKPLSEFIKTRTARGAVTYYSMCKQCYSENRNKRYARLQKALAISGKECTKCGRLLPVEDFKTAKKGKYLYKIWTCPDCINEYFRKYRERKRLEKKEAEMSQKPQGVIVSGNSPLSPSHYSRFRIQPMDFIAENGLDFLQGNIIKYVVRYDAKNGVEDLKKARVYLDRLIMRTEARASEAAVTENRALHENPEQNSIQQLIAKCPEQDSLQQLIAKCPEQDSLQQLIAKTPAQAPELEPAPESGAVQAPEQPQPEQSQQEQSLASILPSYLPQYQQRYQQSAGKKEFAPKTAKKASASKPEAPRKAGDRYEAQYDPRWRRLHISSRNISSAARSLLDESSLTKNSRGVRRVAGGWIVDVSSVTDHLLGEWSLLSAVVLARKYKAETLRIVKGVPTASELEIYN